MSARPGMRYRPVPSTTVNVSGTATSFRFPTLRTSPPETSTV